ncbi:MAG TPA: hypothetical protein VGA60_01455 [Kiloniellales bacterium]
MPDAGLAAGRPFLLARALERTGSINSESIFVSRKAAGISSTSSTALSSVLLLKTLENVGSSPVLAAPEPFGFWGFAFLKILIMICTQNLSYRTNLASRVLGAQNL